ncbi:MAG: PAS domain S-box protein [Acidobacteriota bacterium]|jgi:PAS domain S-box-containing protein|nr:PAS domain S-box protein [Acidobacteriota bacterium]
MSAERQKTLLLVEDEAVIAMSEKMALEKFGYAVLIAVSGEEAVAIVAKNPAIDLILMDINLGAGMDGTEAAALILKDHDLPVVFLSSHAEPEVVAKTEKITSYGYVVKHSSLTALDASIKMAFKLFAAKTKEREKEAALSESEEWNKRILGTVLSGVMVIDADTRRIVEVNETGLKLIGLAKEQIVGSTCHRFVCPAQMHNCPVLDLGKDVDLSEKILLAADGKPKSIIKTVVPIMRSGHKYLIESFVDISERKRMEQELLNSKERYESFFMKSMEGVYLLDLDKPMPVTMPVEEQIDYLYDHMKIAECNPALLEMYGIHDASEILGKTQADMHGGKDNPVNRDSMRRIIESGYNLRNTVTEEVNARGERCYFSNNTIGIVRDGFLLRSWGTQIDITKQKRVEQALLESAERMRAIVEGTPHLFFYTQDAAANTTYVSPTIERITGYEADTWLKQKNWFLTDNPINRSAKEATRAHLRGELLEKPVLLEIRHAQGHAILLEVYEYPIMRDGMIVGLQGVAHNVSEQKRAERERALLQEIAQGILSTGDLHEFLGIVHQAIAKIIHAENFFVVLYNKETGMFEEAYVADKFDPSFPPSKLEKSLSKYVFRSGRPLRLVSQQEFAELENSGEVELVGTPSPSWMGVPLMAAGEAIGVMVTQDYEQEERYSPHDLDLFISISGQVALAVERKRWEDAVKRQLEEKSILLKEVHHRIKNNIASIGGLISLRMQSLSNPEAIAVLQDAIGRVDSMRILYDKLLLGGDYKDIPVKNYIESLADTVVALFPGQTTVRLEKRIADFNLDAKRLFPLGIILNELLTNIMKYAFIGKSSGLIRISLTHSGKHVTLTLQDDGSGLPDGFDINESKGFGLMLVKMLSQQLGGSFAIATHKGTRCQVEFTV